MSFGEIHQAQGQGVEEQQQLATAVKEQHQHPHYAQGARLPVKAVRFSYPIDHLWDVVEWDV